MTIHTVGSIWKGDDMKQTIEVLKKKNLNIASIEGIDALTTAITALEDYAKLKEELSVVRAQKEHFIDIEREELEREIAKLKAQKEEIVKEWEEMKAENKRLKAEKDHLRGIKFVPNMQSWEDLTQERNELKAENEALVVEVKKGMWLALKHKALLDKITVGGIEKIVDGFMTEGKSSKSGAPRLYYDGLDSKEGLAQAIINHLLEE